MAIVATMGGPYNSGVVQSSGMILHRNDTGSSDSLVAMLGPCSPHVGLQGNGGLEDAVLLQGSGQKRPYFAAFEGPSVEDGPEEVDEGGDDCSPGGSQLEKKRRLTFDQVRSLEKNFEMENKLEPERKMQLAKELGLRPRQVAVWFQNRRARWKTKQLERDYEALAQDYKRLKTDYDRVLGEKNNLKQELKRLSALESGGVVNEDGESGGQSANSAPTPQGEFSRHHTARSSPTVDVSEKDSAVETSGCSNSSDVLDADSPRTTDSSSLSPTSDREQFINSPEFPPECSFMVPDEEAVKLEDSDTTNHVNVFPEDNSCNYLLLQLDDQSGVLPWWDWP